MSWWLPWLSLARSPDAGSASRQKSLPASRRERRAWRELPEFHVVRHSVDIDFGGLGAYHAENISSDSDVSAALSDATRPVAALPPPFLERARRTVEAVGGGCGPRRLVPVFDDGRRDLRASAHGGEGWVGRADLCDGREEDRGGSRVGTEISLSTQAEARSRGLPASLRAVDTKVSRT